MNLWENIILVRDEIENRLNDFKITELTEIPDEEKIKLETGIWYRLNDLVCVYLDLKDSTRTSFENTKEEMAKIYEYIGISITKIFSFPEIKSDFIDVKGDGGFALFQGRYSEIKALLCAITFKTYSYKHMKKRFPDVDIKFGIGISKGNLLLKKVGIRSWNFYGWAGKVINYAAYLCKEVKQRFDFELDVIGADKNIYNSINNDAFKNWLVWSCGCPHNKKVNLWNECTTKEEFIPNFYYLQSNWCDKHGEEYINKVLEIVARKQTSEIMPGGKVAKMGMAKEELNIIEISNLDDVDPEIFHRVKESRKPVREVIKDEEVGLGEPGKIQTTVGEVVKGVEGAKPEEPGRRRPVGVGKIGEGIYPTDRGGEAVEGVRRVGIPEEGGVGRELGVSEVIGGHPGEREAVPLPGTERERGAGIQPRIGRAVTFGEAGYTRGEPDKSAILASGNFVVYSPLSFTSHDLESHPAPSGIKIVEASNLANVLIALL